MPSLVEVMTFAAGAKHYQGQAFAQAGQTGTVTVEPPANEVAWVYEIDVYPADINAVVSVTGPNVSGNLSFRPGTGAPIPVSFLATPGGACQLTLTNNTDSGAAIIVRWVQLSVAAYRKLLNPAYKPGESAEWAASVDRQYGYTMPQGGLAGVPSGTAPAKGG